MATDLAVLSDTYTEKLNQWGLLLSVCTYGAHVALFFRCLRSFWTQRDRRHVLVVYTVVLFSCATTAIALQIWWTQVAFIDNRSYNGGPQQFLLDHYFSGSNRALTMMYVLMNWLADGLILYRFYVLCGCTVLRSRPIALAFVGTCFVALVVVSTVFFPNITSLGINLWTNSPSIAPGIAYMAVSLSVNTSLTFLIICRILLIRRSLQQTLGPHYSQTYTSIISLLIESAALYTIVGLMTVITCGVGSPIQYALLPMLGQLQAIPPVLITSRVAEGVALSRSKYTELQSSRFRTLPRTRSDLAYDVKFSPPSQSESLSSPTSPVRSISTTCSSVADLEPPITPMKPTLKLTLPDPAYSPRRCSTDLKLDFDQAAFTSTSDCTLIGRTPTEAAYDNSDSQVASPGTNIDVSQAV
ncbi:hypothetical protein BDY19DRAFT_943685 [Irpex rosettiformis]|uniref:Uncharacterized protein n=1 Tax=Irpex rosettiformis TaxID=378272 RepID=A0ACB8U5Q0_9APHY|nr:hypothetical protein BDY19DRAFT_943685 [Irpex rosettiformis]